MNVTRREFMAGGMAAVGAAAFAAAGTASAQRQDVGAKVIAVQLYSIGQYIHKNGLDKALAEVVKIGYKAVEFNTCFGKSAAELKRALGASGLAVCGAHVHKRDFGPDRIKAACEYHLGFGNNLLICAGAGNFPRKGEDVDEFMKRHVDYYNVAAETAAKYGCKIGLHNHTPEFDITMKDGTTYFDYFFSHTRNEVCMEQDVGWTACTGRDPCEQWRKYPHRSVTMHAKEDNGRRKRCRLRSRSSSSGASDAADAAS